MSSNGNGHHAPQLLVVDDEEPVRRALVRVLTKGGYEASDAGGVDVALGRLSEQPFDLVLCDVQMPGRSGIDLVEELARSHPDTAVIMVTGVDDPAFAGSAIERGAYGYVIKPFERSEILINVKNALRRRALEIENRSHREELEKLVEARTADLRRTLDDLRRAETALRASHEETIRILAHAAEHKDSETGSHLQRMSRYSAILGGRYGFDPDNCELLRLASPMHDIGKIGIPDTVLYKAGAFTDDDRAIMGRHPQIGYEILDASASGLLKMAATIALTHHEKFDGTGYPRGLSGDDIPIEGRIVAIGDVFDALTTTRRYKEAWTFEQARAEMEQEKGRHFDPALVDLFFADIDEIEKIRTRYPDPD
jgi:putative two-component system response regulator